MRKQISVVTVFLGSMLLFCVQPLLGRTLLPAFGGSAAVWTVCLASYQTLLLIGYLYAHMIHHLSISLQRRIHLFLLFLSVVWTFGFIYMLPKLQHIAGNSSNPSLEVLLCVLIAIGLPYILLSSSSTLVQSWMAKFSYDKKRSVYKLYAISNIGSFAGLLLYPLLIEPLLSVSSQWILFGSVLLLYSVVMGGFASLCVINSSVSTLNKNSEFSDKKSISSHTDSVFKMEDYLKKPWLWFALPALSTLILNSTTFYLSVDVTPIPLLWVILLSAFLISYVIGFSGIGEKLIFLWSILAVASIAGSIIIYGITGETNIFTYKMIFGLSVILFCGIFLHSWLYKIRPENTKLTYFYLGIATGGAAGGLFASLAAPILFNDIYEFPLALILCLLICSVLFKSWKHKEIAGITNFITIACYALILLTVIQQGKRSKNVIVKKRNFYSCFNVKQTPVKMIGTKDKIAYCLDYGGVTHGLQVKDDFLCTDPTLYFTENAGGAVFKVFPGYTNAPPLRVALVGLGIGTMATYGRTNDLYRFFEINPQVIALARNPNYFTYLSDSKATIEIIEGDARKSLERENEANEPLYDVMILDAFNGDSIPLHLASAEAFDLFKARLKKGGVMAMHISNWHIDLLPLCKQAAKHIGFNVYALRAEDKPLGRRADWVLFSEKPLDLSPINAKKANFNSVKDIPLIKDGKGSTLFLINYTA